MANSLLRFLRMHPSGFICPWRLVDGVASKALPCKIHRGAAHEHNSLLLRSYAEAVRGRAGAGGSCKPCGAKPEAGTGESGSSQHRSAGAEAGTVVRRDRDGEEQA